MISIKNGSGVVFIKGFYSYLNGVYTVYSVRNGKIYVKVPQYGDYIIVLPSDVRLATPLEEALK